MKDQFAAPPSIEDLRTMADAAFLTIPEELRRHADGIAFHVHDFPDRQIELSMGLQSPFDLLGLYSGVSLADKSVGGTAQDIDRIYLFRRPILDYWCETGGPLFSIVRHVLIHEIGHHFGLSDDDMEQIEAQA
jgi:predicted Zn-dependent protease with MMP-like domain